MSDQTTGIDYTVLALPKSGETTKQRRAKRRRKTLKAAAATRDSQVMNRYGGRCIAEPVSPGCRGRAVDPHELVTVGAGGSRVDPDNRVPVCRWCHEQAQGRVGGIRLLFGWVGKLEGQKPMATKLGSILVTWRPNQSGYDPPFARHGNVIAVWR
jgi:hypothetical protein